ncbi:MAG: FUSC family protein [Gordonia sp. (in: high G+C Gram-positive bacteria)]|uniref:FUSC family protein n=1 Tax=Gordonia sp. (in: high G+C Gram-positive bacteria) TaxID=84139 RepID=UPI003C76C2A4
MNSDPLVPPGRPSVRALLWTRPSVRGRWAPATRAGLAFMLPAMILLGCGLERNAILVALGSFAVLFGERRPYRIRWKAIVTAGLLLVATSASFGALGAWAGPADSIPRESVTVLALAALTAVSVFGVNALRLGPPGPFFLIMVGGVAVIAARHGTSIGLLVLATAAGAVSSLLVSMAPALWRPHGPEMAATEAALAESERFLAANREPSRRHGVASSTLNAWSVLHDAAQTDGELAHRLWQTHHRVHGVETGPTMTAPLPRPAVAYRLRSAARPDSHATVTAARAATTALIAGAISVFAGLGRPDWAIMGAVLILQLGPDRVRGSVRGLHRVLGTLIGLAIFAVLHTLDLHTAALIVCLAVLNVMIELTVTTNYALAVTFITPLALLMGAPSQPLADQMLSRTLETLLGVGLAIAAAWLLFPHVHRRTLRSADEAARSACSGLLNLAAANPPMSPLMRLARRDLQWQLLESEMAATDSANDEPSWSREYWPSHAAVRAVGYATLSACWQTPAEELIPASVRQELTARTAAALE